MMAAFPEMIEREAIDWCSTGLLLNESDKRAVTTFTKWLMQVGGTSAVVALKPIKDAPRDGREVLCTDGKIWRVCVPKAFSQHWEYFRDEQHAPSHTWSMVPTHFILLEDLPQVPHGA